MLKITPRSRLQRAGPAPAPCRTRNGLLLLVLLGLSCFLGGVLVAVYPPLAKIDREIAGERAASARVWGRNGRESPQAVSPIQALESLRIPRIIHQTWKDSSVPQWALPTTHSWRDMNPDYEYRLWDDKDAEALIRERYPELVPAYMNHMVPVQRADVFRYAVVHAFGGVYADIDVHCNVPVDNWLQHDLFNVDMILGWEALSSRKEVEAKHFAVEYQLCQWTFAAAPGNWLLRSVLDDIVAYYDRKMHEVSVSIIRSTGPGMFSSAIQRALKRRFNITFGDPPLTKEDMKMSKDMRRIHIGRTMILPLESFGYRPGVRGGGSGANRLVTHRFRGSWKAAYKKRKEAANAAKAAARPTENLRAKGAK